MKRNLRIAFTAITFTFCLSHFAAAGLARRRSSRG